MIWGVLQFPGSCDERDALHACGLLGEARLIWHEEHDLGGVDAVVIPGGFSYGDYLRAGALLLNESLRFVHRQVELLDERTGEALSIPIKHGEGRFWAPDDVLDGLEAEGQVAYRYAEGQNPNGSARDIAGVRNEAGNVLGLMPHPEHAVDELTGSTDGLKVFEALAGARA